MYRIAILLTLTGAIFGLSSQANAQFVDYRIDDSWFTDFSDQTAGNFCNGKQNFNGSFTDPSRCPTIATSTNGNKLIFNYPGSGTGGLEFTNGNTIDYGEIAFTVNFPSNLTETFQTRISTQGGSFDLFVYDPTTEFFGLSGAFNSDDLPGNTGSTYTVNVQWQVVGNDTNVFLTIDGNSFNATFNNQVAEGVTWFHSTEPGSGSVSFSEMQYSPFSGGGGNVQPTGDFFINWLKPKYGTTTASNTVELEANFFNNTEYATTTRLQIDIVDALTGVLEESSFVLIPPNTSTNVFFNTDFTLATGSKIAIAEHVVASNDRTIIPPEEHFFSVINNTYQETTGLKSPQGSSGIGSGLSQIDCQTFDVGCQFQKAMTFLFTPSPNALNKFALLWREIGEIPPFSIFVTLQNIRENLDTQGITPAFNIPQIPFTTQIFDPLKTGVGAILWVIFGFYVYNRFKYLEI